MFEILSAQKMNVSFQMLWDVTGTKAAKQALSNSPGGSSYADGSLIPGANYSAQDDHSGMHIAGL
ncbi:hypothetical protein T484DRAFT_1811557 [Baffinella frigidus]|nr:hypothetical protein T484DRAFT_1811557 [Cryptophyta sp. CCMP2293]